MAKEQPLELLLVKLQDIAQARGKPLYEALELLEEHSQAVSGAQNQQSVPDNHRAALAREQHSWTQDELVVLRTVSKAYDKPLGKLLEVLERPSHGIPTWSQTSSPASAQSISVLAEDSDLEPINDEVELMLQQNVGASRQVERGFDLTGFDLPEVQFEDYGMDSAIGLGADNVAIDDLVQYRTLDPGSIVVDRTTQSNVPGQDHAAVAGLSQFGSEQISMGTHCDSPLPEPLHALQPTTLNTIPNRYGPIEQLSSLRTSDSTEQQGESLMGVLLSETTKSVRTFV